MFIEIRKEYQFKIDVQSMTGITNDVATIQLCIIVELNCLEIYQLTTL